MIKPLPVIKSATDPEVIQFLRNLLKKAHAQRIVWLTVDCAAAGKFGQDEFITYDYDIPHN